MNYGRAPPIEDLNFKDDSKIMLLIAIVVMAYVLSRVRLLRAAQ